MKKNYDFGMALQPNLKKLIMKLKISILIILVSLGNIFASNTYSQTAKVTLNAENKTLEQVMDEIEQQSEFYFIFNQTQIDFEKVLTVKADNTSIDEILTNLFSGTNIHYAILDRKILLLTEPLKKNLLTTALDYKQQQVTVSGTITDARTGEGMPGVNIQVKGTTIGTTSNVDGKYLLNVPDKDATLIFSFIGYITQEIPLNGRNTIEVTLASSVTGLEEVVVVGFGTQRRVNLTGSVASIKAEEIVKRPSPSVGSLIQGKMPGLQIIQQSGEPGNEKLKIAIRGQGTFSSAGSNPLVVIDGVAYPTWTSLNNLDPDNIESIDILKDAASASIYGARAANGVILVTTKKGVAGKPIITYHGSTGFQKATFIPDFIDNSAEYMEMYNYTVDRQGTGTKFSQSLIDAYKNAGPNDPQYPNYDWRDAVFRNGWGNDHSLSVSGGNENSKYYASVGYYNQDPIIKGQKYDRYSAQFNLDTKIAEWITFNATINGLVGKKLGPATSIGQLMMNIYDMNPTTSPRLPDGRWSVGSVMTGYYMTGNPVRLTDTGGDGGKRLTEHQSITATGSLNIKLIPDLVWNITVSYYYDTDFEKVHHVQPSLAEEYYFQSGSFARLMYLYFQGVSDSWTGSVMPSFYSTLNYTKTFAESHNLVVLLGYNQEYFKQRYLSGNRKNYGFPNLEEINAGDAQIQTLSGTSSDWAIQSLFGRLRYDYKGKYLFEGNIRYDGTSRIHKDTRWGLFPSFSAAWRLSEESFLKSSKWIDNLKIRGSIGQLGNQNIGNYPYQSLLSTTNYAQGTGIVQGVVSTTLSDKTLKWEVTTITNLGLDLSMRNGLFSLIFDAYNKDTEGILNRAEIPASVGMSPPMINYGAMNNKGFEIVIGHRNSINDFSYSVDLNYSRNRNKITNLITPSYGLQSNQVGHEFGAHYMVEWIGVFQSQEEIDAAPVHQFNPKPGDLRFKDQNGDLVINSNDRVILPGRYPKFIYGGNIGLNWKNLDLSLFVQGVAGTRHFITRRGEWPFLRMAPPSTLWRDAWTPENPTNDLPALYAWPYSPVSGTDNSFFLKNTSYVRLKNLQIGYTIPGRITQKLGIQDLRVYVSADNWFTFSPFTTHDPERDEDVHYSYQTEAGSYPNVKTLTFGIKLSLNKL